MSLANIFVGGLQLALGYKAISAGLRGLGVTAPAKSKSLPRADKAALSIERARRFPVEARIEKMRQMVRKGWEDPNLIIRFREESLKVLTRECGKRPKDGMTEWCVPRGTLLLRRPGELVPIEHVEAGQEVMGDGGWTRVLKAWNRGEQDLLAFRLNNGGVLRCTPEHTLFVVPRRTIDGRPSRTLKWTPVTGSREDAVEVPAHDVRVGDDLLQPERLPFGTGAMGADRAFIMGAYIAEGWLEPSRASIAGIPNSKGIREKVIEAAQRLGLRYSADRHKVRLMGRDVVAWLNDCGDHAFQKRVPTLDLDETSVRALVDGVNADAHQPPHPKGGLRPPIFCTTSPLLALQYRVLQRMLGRSANIGIESKREPGHHPVYVVGVRDPDGGRHTKKWAKVLAVEGGGKAETFDIETESRRFYLPESDVVVHNCVPATNWKAEIHAVFFNVRRRMRYTMDPRGIDFFQSPQRSLAWKGGDCGSFTIMLAWALMAVGYECMFRVVRTHDSQDWNHVFLLARKPGTPTWEWLTLDASVDRPPGWHPPEAMIAAVKDFHIL